jgi:16S rRNA (guanine527-N7)-methyltransferase
MDIEDCATILPFIPHGSNVLDIGSGAGLPGLVIAINSPTTKVLMSEKNKKKAYFINKTIQSLGIKNADIINAPISKNTKLDKKFSIITARALASARQIVELSEQLLTKDGKFILMKGTKQKIKEEVAELNDKKYSYTIHNLNNTTKERHILEIY